MSIPTKKSFAIGVVHGLAGMLLFTTLLSLPFLVASYKTIPLFFNADHVINQRFVRSFLHYRDGFRIDRRIKKQPAYRLLFSA
ncbi:hypothetical protein [Domibacillus sp. PGB-M46]|uniref:hypothetical protein n=1 Tax=Domibacillus sp. PGB-M46 TaxID=2910255 RepID=UPI002814DE16|nr:hypothetical protein [Domibacillus sp. PGB-M46]